MYIPRNASALDILSIGQLGVKFNEEYPPGLKVQYQGKSYNFGEYMNKGRCKLYTIVWGEHHYTRTPYLIVKTKEVTL